MFTQVMISISLGILFGIITGLTPGIHINLIAVTLLTISPILLKYTDIIPLSIFIIAMSVTHSFLDSIPSIFLGAPDSSTALGVLPGHRYLLKGYGLMAVKLTAVGSFGALILSTITYPLLIPVVKYAYPLIQDSIGFILIAVVIFMILRDKKKLWSSFIFIMSGTLGIIVLTWPNLENPLFPLLSGLFGVSTLLYSIKEKNKIPKQKIQQRTKLEKKLTLKALLSGQFSGFLTAVLPGVGAATAAVLSLQITRNLGDKGFMMLMGSISTANFIMSILTLQILNKARNGSIVVIQELISAVTIKHILLFLASVLVSGAIALFLTIKIGKIFSKLITKINYLFLVVAIISFIIFLTIVLTGKTGLLILVTSTAIGIIPAIVKTARIHSMGCLLLPVIFFFIL